jgi:hypothetical protein
MIGYYVIIGAFILIDFLASIGEGAGAGGFVQGMYHLGWLLGMFVTVSLLRRIRLQYQIKGDCDECAEKCSCCNFCGCCNDGCSDVSKAVFCQCCTAYQIGNHLFDYSKNNEVTYEAVPTHFVV